MSNNIVYSLRKIGVVALCVLAGAFDASAEQRDACSLVDTPEREFLVHVPFEVVDGRIYVAARVNGRGPFRFAIDTGASGIGRADTSLVTELNLNIQGQANNSDGVKNAKADTTQIDSLELGGMSMRDAEVITRDYNSRMSADAAFSGIIARDFFADGLLIIDYPRKILRFSRTVTLSSADNDALRYERAFRVPVSIGDMKLEGNIDTGANVALVLPQSLYEKVSAEPLKQAGVGRLTNVEIKTGRTTITGPFGIGGVSLSNIEARVSDRYPELLVGAHVLQNFVILIDQRSKSIALCK